MIQSGERVLILLDDEETSYIVKVSEGEVLATHYGNLVLNSLIGKEYGSSVSLGFKKAYLLKPSMVDGIFSLKRSTQIVYPKDIAFITLYLDIKEGDTVYEAGTGTGVMTSVFSRLVGPSGSVVTYEKRKELAERARKNVELLGNVERVVFVADDIANCKDSQVADAFFLDLPDTLSVIKEVVAILKGSGRICVLCPTTNQVQDTIRLLREMNIVNIHMWETMVRSYKTNPERLRPEDRMIGHTAYMVFGIKVEGRDNREKK